MAVKRIGVLIAAFAAIFMYISTVNGTTKQLGKLNCTAKGFVPDQDLVNLVMSKCPLKTDQNKTMVSACLCKCFSKQCKAVDKKGKLKKDKIQPLLDVFPKEFREQVSKKFDECYKQHNNELVKEATGCNSWVGLSSCFFDYGYNLCKKKE